MRILQITEETRYDAQKVIEFAKKNIITLAQNKLISKGDSPPVGDNPDYVLYIHDGYRIVFCIEQQAYKVPIKGKTFGLCNHISVSIEDTGKYPGVPMVGVILGLFEMNPKIEDSLALFLEKGTESVNIIQERVED